MSKLGLPERIYLANDLNTPKDTLWALGLDEDSRVRWWVARNPSTPPEVLTFLIQDLHWGVRRAVGRNPSSPYGIWNQDGPFRVFP